MKGAKNYAIAEDFLERITAKKYKTRKELMELYASYLAHTRKAAYAGHGDAQQNLGYHYDIFTFLSSDNPDFDPVKRNYWFKKAGDNNIANACNNLGFAYEMGEGCKKDLIKSLEFFRKAATLDMQFANNFKIMMKQLSPGGNHYDELIEKQRTKLQKIASLPKK